MRWLTENNVLNILTDVNSSSIASKKPARQLSSVLTIASRFFRAEFLHMWTDLTRNGDNFSAMPHFERLSTSG